MTNSSLQKINSIRFNWGIPSLSFTVTLAIISVIYLLDTTTVNEFIYFQF